MPVRQVSSQRQILALLEQLKQEISAQDLYLELHRQEISLGLATVYRALKALKREGIIQERVSPKGESLYRLMTADHQHHLNCVRCGKSIPLEYCPINQKVAQWCQLENFKVYYHTLEFFGLCTSCQP